MKRKLSALILIVLSIFLSDDLFADPMFGKKELITDDWQFILNDSPELPDANQNWLKVDLPHDWSVRGQLSPTLASCTGYLPGGTGWYKKKLKKTTIFDSNILSSFNGSKGVKGMKGKLR